jgi:hypothetical protein
MDDITLKLDYSGIEKISNAIIKMVNALRTSDNTADIIACQLYLDVQNKIDAQISAMK